MSLSRFRSVVQVASAVTTFSSKHNQQRPHKKSCTVLLEDCTDLQHTLPPHHYAANGDLEPLKEAVKNFSLTLNEKDKNWSTLLHYATGTNQVAIMKYLIENGINLDAADKNGNTALHVATSAGHVEAIHLLLNSGASQTAVNNMKDAPLHTAAREISGRSFDAYLSHSVNYFLRGFRNRTVLHIIAEVDSIDSCQVLYKMCSGSDHREVAHDPNDSSIVCLCSRDEDGLTAVHLAAKKNSFRVLEFFISTCRPHKHSVKSLMDFIDEENSTPLHAAIDAGNIEVARVLLKHGACPLVIKGDIPPPLHLACSQGRLEIVREIVDLAGKEILQRVDQNQRSPLHYSAFSIHSTSIISYIANKGGLSEIAINQQDNNGRTPLHMSISSGNLNGARELLARGADPFVKDGCGLNALHFAVLHNRKAIIHMLLEIPNSDELANEINKMGYSPMHIGLKLGLKDIVSTLVTSVQLQSKNVKDPNGNNYIHLSASSGDCNALAAFKELNNAHNLINETNDRGITPLHCAAKNGHSQFVEILITCGAMVHRCHKGTSPLMLACSGGHIECARILYKAYPFQIDWQDSDGDTALHYAARSGSPSMIQKVLDLGCKIVHNDSMKSFLDLLISTGNEDCGLAVVNHRRWQECLDVVSPDLENPMLCLIQHMPTIAKAVLDRCHTKKSTGGKLHTETFNFKYLLSHETEPAESQIQSDQTKQDHSRKDRAVPVLTRIRTRMKGMDEVVISNLETVDTSDDLRGMTLNHSNSMARKENPSTTSNSKKKMSKTMEVLKRMMEYKRVDLLVHPVVSAYLKQKWKSYGQFLYAFDFGILILLVFFLTMFVLLSPRPGPGHFLPAEIENITNNDTLAGGNQTGNVSENAAVDGTPGQVFGFLAVFMNSVFAVGVIIGLLTQGWKSINIVERILYWISTIAIVLNYIFLLSPNPFGLSTLPFGAGACFFSWLALFGALEFIDVFGIYVNMFFRILRTAFQVLVVCLFLLIAFALALYVIAREVTEFSNIGFALFTVFGYMLGEIQYSLFIEKIKNETRAEVSICYIMVTFIVVLAIMLSIVMANLLIGLAVGDIERIKQNAIYQKRGLEISFFTSTDNYTPRCLQHVITIKSHVIHHTGKKSRTRRVFDFFLEKVWSEVLDNPEIANTDKQGTANSAPVDIASEISQIKLKLQEVSDLLHTLNRQGGEKDRGHHCRWKKAQSTLSIDSNQSDISMTASDFLHDFA